MDPQTLIDAGKWLVLPCALLFVGACGAGRLALSDGGRKQRVFSAVVALSLAAATTVSILKIPMDMDGLRVGNPYPIGIGGLIPEERTSGILMDLY